MDFFSSWQILFLIFVVFISTYFQVVKFALRGAKNDGAAMIILQFFGALPALCAIPFFDFKYSNDWRLYALLFCSLVFYSLSDRLQATGRKHLSVSLYTLILQSYNLFLFILGVIFYHEEVSGGKFGGMALIILGNIILFYRKEKLQINKYVVISFLSAFFLALGIAIDVGNSKNFTLPLYISIVFLVPRLLIKIFDKVPVSAIRAEFFSSRQKYFVVAGVAWGFASMFYYLAAHRGGVTSVAALDGGTALLNVVLAFLIFKQEEVDKLRKLLAGILIISGVMLVLN